MKYGILFLPVVLLGGCGTLTPAVQQAAKVNDEAVRVAEFALCHGASVGAIRRHYGTPDRAAIWRSLCNSTDEFNLGIPGGGDGN